MIENVLKNLRNIPGWRTNRKIIIFESDDWGSIRFRDKATRDLFIANNYPVDKCWMSMIDCLESNDDMQNLLEVISTYKDINGNAPVFTFFLNPANPDFDKIKQNHFQSYYFEPFNETLQRYPKSDEVMKWYFKGIENDLINIQFHGREHLYADRWLRDLEMKKKDTLFGFDYDFFGFSKSFATGLNEDYGATFDVDTIEDLTNQSAAIQSGLDIIKTLFKKEATVFVAPNGPFNFTLAKSLFDNRIKYIGLPKIHFEPFGNKKKKRKYVWLGKVIEPGLKVITRNAVFEPSSPKFNDWVNVCLNDIDIAFKWKKPAVISSHRVNYIGALNVTNRENGLTQLSQLLKIILKKWPDVEFFNSAELGDIIAATKR